MRTAVECRQGKILYEEVERQGRSPPCGEQPQRILGGACTDGLTGMRQAA